MRDAERREEALLEALGIFGVILEFIAHSFEEAARISVVGARLREMGVAHVANAPGRYRLADGLCGAFEEAKRCYGARTSPYEHIDLFNRYDCGEAELVLRGYPATMAPPFGSVVDLTSGLERPAALDRADGDYILRWAIKITPRKAARPAPSSRSGGLSTPIDAQICPDVAALHMQISACALSPHIWRYCAPARAMQALL